MVVKMDIVHDMCQRFDQVPESMKVNHLGLQRVVKRFHICIIPAAAFTTLTVQQVMLIEYGIQLFVSELRTPVCMEDRAFQGLMILQCHQRCFFGQARITLPGEAPANDLAGIQIHHRAQIVPMLAHLNVSHITDPDLIRLVGWFSIQEQVSGFPEQMMLMAVLAKAPEHLCDHVVFSHQTGYSMLTTGFTVLSQGIKNPRIAVGFSTLRVYLHNLIEQVLIGLLAGALRSFLPGVITASTDTQLPAQSCD